MKTLFFNRTIQVAIRDEKGRDVLFYHVFRNGNRGVIFGLNGVGMKHINYEHLKELVAYCQMTEFEAVMKKNVLEILIKSLPEKFVRVEYFEEIPFEGDVMQRVIFYFTE